MALVGIGMKPMGQLTVAHGICDESYFRHRRVRMQGLGPVTKLLLQVGVTL